jgi:parallel beta-helix repeat protein
MCARTAKLRTLVVTAIAAGALVAVPAIQSLAETGRPTVDVRSYGALGDGSTDDTAAIQRANDTVAAAGGGTVLFPAGMYVAANVKQDSNVEFVGIDDATLTHVDGVSNLNIIESRVFKKNGAIPEGSRRLKVSDTRGVLPGAIVGIRGAGGASSVQTSKLASGVTSKSLSLTVTQSADWDKGPSYLLVDNEVLSYSGISGGTFLNIQRGQLGTRAGSHIKGARISLLSGLYARVVRMGSNWIDLDRVAVQGVQNVNVYVGSINMAVRGLALDGNRVPNGSTNNPLPLRYEFARWVTIEGNMIYSGDHGAMSLAKGTSDSIVAGNILADNGTTSTTFGSAVWLSRGASDNTIINNDIVGDTNHGIMVDDRSESATEWDAPSDRNLISTNRIDVPRVPLNTGIWITGSQGNVVENNDVSSVERGISVSQSTQGTYPAAVSGTVVRNNRLNGHDTGLYVTGTNNWFERNQITATRRPIFAKGTGNTYIENSIG